MKIFIFILTILTAFIASSQTLTLDDAINIALKKSLDIELARMNLDASQVNNAGGLALALPQVNGTLSDNQSLTNLNQELSNGTNIKRSNNANNVINAGMAANMLVFNGFRIQATRSKLSAIEKQSTEQLKAQINNVVSAVVIKYYDIVRQQSYIQTIQQSINVTQKQKEIIDARKGVGLANNADLFQAQLDLNASLQEMQSQQLILMQAKSDLMNLLGQRPDSNYIIKDTIIVDRSLSLDSIQAAINRNPELVSAGEQVRINELAEREVGAQRYPSVSVSGGYNYARNQSSAGNFLLNQNYGPFVGLNVTVPIFNGGLYKRQQRVAEIETRKSGVLKEQLLNNLQTSATRSWQAYKNNLDRLVTEQENKKLADSLLQIVQARYQYNVNTIIEVREAQRSFVEAGFRLVNLAYAAKLAEIELKRISNSLVF